MHYKKCLNLCNSNVSNNEQSHAHLLETAEEKSRECFCTQLFSSSSDRNIAQRKQIKNPAESRFSACFGTLGHWDTFSLAILLARILSKKLKGKQTFPRVTS